MGLATAWAASQPADKPAAGKWTTPVRGIQCRLSVTKPSFDVDELLPAARIYNKTEVVLSIKNTSSEMVQIKTTTYRIRLLVQQDGRPVAPLFEQDWPEEERTWDPRSVFNHQWLDPGKEIAFPVLFVGHDSNFGTPLARYWLKPGRYQVKAIFRTSVRGARHADPVKSAQIETNTIDFTVTGTSKPLPRWSRRRADISEAIPAATKKLSDELLQLPPRKAAERYVQEYGKALDTFSTIASELTCKSAWSNHVYEKLTHVKGVGFVRIEGPDIQTARPIMWRDYVRKATVMDRVSSGETWVAYEGSSLLFGFHSFSPIRSAFRMHSYLAGKGSQWEAWREGDVLFISTGYYHELVGIDLRNLAVLFREAWGYLYHYEKQHYLEGFPFPVSRRCVSESYSGRRAAEPERTWVQELQVTLHKAPLKDFTVRPIPRPNTPGYTYYLPYDGRQLHYPSRLQIRRGKDGVLVGQLFDGNKAVAGNPGDVRRNPLGNLVYQQSVTRSGWFLEIKN
jgi:hypothetical protein